MISAHTLSKALGCHGGVIAGDAALIGKLRDDAPAFVAHSPSPLPVAAAAARALDLVGGVSQRRARLWANVAYARAGLRELGWELADTPVPIICLGARPGLDLARIQAELFARDLCVAHVTRYSSTPAGGALRIAVFATHTEAQIDRLVGDDQVSGRVGEVLAIRAICVHSWGARARRQSTDALASSVTATRPRSVPASPAYPPARATA